MRIREFARLGGALWVGLLASSGVAQVSEEPRRPRMTLTPAESANLATSLVGFGISIYNGADTALAAERNVTLSSPEADTETLTRDFRQLGSAYESQMRQGAAEGAFVRSAGNLIITGGATIASMTGVGAIPAAFATAGATWVNDRVAANVQAEGEQRARAFLSTRLSRWSSAQHQQFSNLVSAGREDEAAALFDRATGLLGEMRTSLGNQGSDVAETYLLNTLQGATYASLRQAGRTRRDVTVLRGEFETFARETNRFVLETEARFQDVEDDLAAMSGRLGAVEQDISGLAARQNLTANQLAATQEILFGQAPLDQRIMMLERGLMPQIDDIDRDRMLNVLRAQREREELIATAGRVVGTIQGANQILNNLGLGNRDINRGVELATVAFQAFQAYAQGNYVGVAVAVSSLFSRTSNPEAERFKAIMRSLAIIHQKLDQVLQLQRQTLEALGRLSGQLATFERRSYERFDRIDYQLRNLSSRTRAILWAPYAACQTAWQSVNNGAAADAPAFLTSELRFSGLPAALRFSRGVADQATPCVDRLDQLFATVREQAVFGNLLSVTHARGTLADSDFAVMPGEDPERTFSRDQLQRYLDDLFTPTSNLVVAGWAGNAASLANVWASLSAPAASVGELDRRLVALGTPPDGGRPRRACSANESLLGARMRGFLCAPYISGDPAEAAAVNRTRAFLSDPMERGQVLLLGQWVGATHRHADFRRPGGAVSTTLAELATHGSSGQGRALVSNYLALLDVAIGQNAMLYGDLTAETIYRAVWDSAAGSPRAPGEGAPVTQQTAWALLGNANNPWLRRNVLMLALDRSLIAEGEAARGAWMAYAQFLAALDSFDWNEASGDAQARRLVQARTFLGGIFRLSDDATLTTAREPGENGVRKFFLKWGALELELPTAIAFRDRRLDYPDGIDALLTQRALFADKLADYELLNGLAPDQRARMARILWQGGGVQ